jgi:hypothetical protein
VDSPAIPASANLHKRRHLEMLFPTKKKSSLRLILLAFGAAKAQHH